MRAKDCSPEQEGCLGSGPGRKGQQQQGPQPDRQHLVPASSQFVALQAIAEQPPTPQQEAISPMGSFLAQKHRHCLCDNWKSCTFFVRLLQIVMKGWTSGLFNTSHCTVAYCRHNSILCKRVEHCIPAGQVPARQQEAVRQLPGCAACAGVPPAAR